VRSKVQAITPTKAAEYLEANTSNRPLSSATVKSFAEAMSRGDWMVTHQGIAFSAAGVLVDGQHRLAAIVEPGQWLYEPGARADSANTQFYWHNRSYRRNTLQGNRFRSSTNVTVTN